MAMFLDSSRFVGTIRFCQVWPVWPSSANLDSAHSQTFRADLTFFFVVVAERECILLCKTFTPKWWRRRPLWVEPRTGYELDWLVLHRVDDDVESGWQNPRECFYFCWSKTRPTTSAGLQFPANRMRGVVFPTNNGARTAPRGAVRCTPSHRCGQDADVDTWRDRYWCLEVQ